MKIAVIGGGAAGFFSAIAAAENYPNAQVTLYEKSKRVLSKVKISGGGRCNVTNACPSVRALSQAYPRGERFLKKAFYEFDNHDCIQWFEARGVPLVEQEDACVFPKAQDSQVVIDCLLKECSRLSIQVMVQHPVHSIIATDKDQWQLHFSKAAQSIQVFDKVIVATGGSPKRKGLEWLESLGHQIVDPVPSLFTFNMPQESVKELMGIVVENNQTSIQGTKLKSDGPLLITHWGMSGPSVLKLSAFGARILSEMNYDFTLQVNWVDELNNERVRSFLNNIVDNHKNKILANYRPYLLPERLWHFLLKKVHLPFHKKWGELGKKGVNKLINVLTNDCYKVHGKTTFKEEFVTCGGLALQDIDVKSMQSKICKNLYFAGEVMDIDGITGGYNFQAAWTTAFIAGKLR